MSEIIIGSNPNCHVVINTEGVSGYHAKITAQGDGINFIIEDLGSTNGTYVNGSQIMSPVRVNVQDQIYLSPNHPLDLIAALETLYQQSMPIPIQKQQNNTSQPFLHAGMSKIVGREEPADIVLSYPFISAQHIRISMQSSNLVIEDLNSRNGTIINNQRLGPHAPQPLTSSDVLFLGTFQVPPYMLREWRAALGETSGHSSNQSIIKKPFVIKDGDLKIGRDPSSDIYIEHPTVSWHHATLKIRGSNWTIKDHKSSNGTFVDDGRIRTAMLTPERSLRIGAVELNLNQKDASNLTFEAIDPTKGVRVDTRNLVRCIPTGQRILDDITISIYPGEMVALMGPSGAGKTTLLDMLTGYRKPTSGTVMYNSLPLFDNWEQLRHSIGYVPQEDIMHRDLTVYETLYNAAKLRLPSDSPETSIKETVNRLLKQMDLEQARDTLIGDENTKGISGGQRKRVNIALELITEPPLLFLDEPTSGLDATSTLKVVTLLRKLADEGKTIIMTIHQPRIEVFEKMNNLILLTKGGKLAYYGPTKEVRGYFEPKTTLRIDTAQTTVEPNPADFVMDILDPLEPEHFQEAEVWKLHYANSAYYQRYVLDRQREDGQSRGSGHKEALKRSAIQQFFVLFKRYFIRKMRDRAALGIQLAQAPIIGVLIACVFAGAWGELEDLATEQENRLTQLSSFRGFTFNFNCSDLDSGGTINCTQMAMEQLQNGIHPSFFLLAAAAFWFGSSNVAKELVSERAIYKREKRVGLRSSSYLLSVFGYQSMIVTLQVFVMVFIVGMALGPLPLSVLFSASVILVITALAGISLGLAISAVSKTDVAAISVIPIVLLPQLILSGYVALFVNFSSFNKFVAAFMPIRWAFSSLLISSYKNICSNDEMGCFCEGGNDSDEVFGKDCLDYEKNGSYGDEYHEGFLLDLEKVIGFADSSNDITWTISHEFFGIFILLFFTVSCLSFTLYSITRKS